LFLVADQTVLLYTLNRRPGATVYPTELWLKLAPDAESEAFAAQLETQDPTRIVLEAHTLGGTLDDLSTDTLSVGLMGLLYLAFFIALALSVVSLLTYVALTVQARRGELGVLRALGISSTWLVMSMALEQVLVMVTGGALGAVLGAVLSYQVLPVLATNTGGTAITPPFLVQVELATLLQYALVLLVVLVFALMTSLVLIRRQSLAQTLRLGEE
jgi:ABC-type antimicrobial peptide transport system permease subunit